MDNHCDNIELDYEPEEIEQSLSSGVNSALTKLLQGGLEDSIRKIVATETAKALQQSKAAVPRAESGTASRTDSVCSATCTFGSRVRAGGDILEPFDPDNKDCNIERWLGKIDQLGEIHGWSEYEKAYFMQAKLQGGAKAWYNRLENYGLSWPEWKGSLRQAFPREHDYAQLLREMLGRHKAISETMTHFYHDKVALIERCGVVGTKALSCLIDGLPRELQANARAYKCATPGELYAGFLSNFDKFQSPQGVRGDTDVGVTLKRHNVNNDTAVSSKFYRQVAHAAPAGGIRCYNCQEIGSHISRDCPKPKAERCMKCGQSGHNRFRCKGVKGSEAQGVVTQTKAGGRKGGCQVRFIQPSDSVFKKTVFTKNGQKLKAYLDTGSEQNIITSQYYNILKISTEECIVLPTSVLLKGFGGGVCVADTEVILSIKVDNIELNITALIADCDLAGADLLLGQPALAIPGIILTVRDNKATLSRADQSKEVEKANQLLEAIRLDSDDLGENNIRRAILLQDISVSPGEDYAVDLELQGLKPGERCFLPARRYGDQGAIVTNSNFILEGNQKATFNIWNCGFKDIKWRAGKVMGRAQLLQPDVLVQKVLVCTKLNVLHDHIDLTNIKIGDIGECNIAKLHKLLSKMAMCFSKDENDLGLTALGEMQINVSNDRPVAYRPYRLSITEKEKVRTKVQNLIETGVIRESESEYASPIVLIPKKNGEIRMCVDYRALNAITLKDRSPLPRIEDQLDRLAGKCYYTTLDLAQGYYQVPMHSNSISKTAFITPDGHYEFLRVPFGLANAPAVFQRVINKMLRGMQTTQVLAYMDDLLIPSATISDGLELLEKVLLLVAEAGLKLNFSKCVFLAEKLEYLGHEVSASGIRPGERKVQAVANFPIPCNVHNVRQFIGLASYFRKFVKSFAIIARPLTDLTKKDVIWRWGECEQAAFDQLKQVLIERPTLGLYDSEAVTELHTDASKLGVAGILLQKNIKGDMKPITYYSRATTSAEQLWHSYELETLAIVESVKRFRVYLIGVPFKVVTDCTAVRATMAKRDILPRIARWWMALQEYDMTVEYRPGAKMQHVDALSRNPVHVCMVNLSEGDWFLTVQLQDDKAQHLITSLESGVADNGVRSVYKVVKGRLYRKTLLGDRLYVPSMSKFSLLRKHHDDIGHPGFDRCLGLIKQTYWFPKMGRFVKKYIMACLNCAYNKGEHGKALGLLHPIEKIAIPFHTIHIDHLGPFCKSKRGNQYLLMVVDAFTKYTLAKPTRSLRSTETILKLREIFCEFGYPRRIVSDRGLAFTSKAFADFTAEKGVKHVLNAIATPRANGQVERQNRTILNAIEADVQAEVEWDANLYEIIWGLNHAINQSTGFSPTQLMFVHGDGTNVDLSGAVGEANAPRASGETYGDLESALLHRRDKAGENLTKARRKMKDVYDRRRKVAANGGTFKVGDLVLWRRAATCPGGKGVNRKITNKYDGPYHVTKVLGNDRYIISTVKGIRGYKNFQAVVAIDSLRRYVSVVPGDVDNEGHGDTDSDGDETDRQDLIDLLES